MNPIAKKNIPVDVASEEARSRLRRPIGFLANVLASVGLLRQDSEYHLLRAAMVLIFFFFGYQKWFL